MPFLNDKIKSIGELSHLPIGRTVVLCHGVWDLLHPGHRAHLKAAKREGDILIVTVTPDRFVNKGMSRPVFNENLRAEGLADLEYVDYVAINKWPTAVETIRLIKPDVYVKGSDYADPDNDITDAIVYERKAIEEVGGRIHFTEEISFSSSELINTYLPIYSEETRTFLRDFGARYSSRDVIQRIRGIKGLRILIVGDTIIDEYIYCLPTGIAPKRKVISWRYLNEERYAGGVLATANQLAQFCNEVCLVTAIGDNKDFIEQRLAPNITPVIFETPAPTVVKRRFIDQESGITLFYLILIDESKMNHQAKLTEWLKANIDSFDVVIVNDFGHGFITKDIVPAFADARFLCINAQTNSMNTGFNLVSPKYPKADYLCQNELEIRLAIQEKDNGINDIIRVIADDFVTMVMAATMGRQGSILYDGSFCQIPSLANKTIDTMGTGDAFLAITSPLVALSIPVDLVGFIGNAIGALKAQIIGSKEVVEATTLFKFITVLLR